jgi:hypothetical protein
MPVLKQQTTALIDTERPAKITQRDRELNSGQSGHSATSRMATASPRA